MRLLYCYTKQDRSTTPQHFMADGRCYLMKRLVEEKIVDEVEVIIHGARVSRHRLFENVTYKTIREMSDITASADDIVWVRGGFKPTTFYEKCVANKRWLMFYGANTGRARWRFWDVVLDDLCGRDFSGANERLYLYYPKPIHPEVFKPMGLKPMYDVCIGASHITDKKGQWMAINAIMDYHERFPYPLKCVMPGVLRRGRHTNQIIDALKKRPGLNIDCPGMVPRSDLAIIFNQSKLFLHCGSGQNDRGLLEAMRCGTPCLMSLPKYHDPLTYTNRNYGNVCPHGPVEIADTIHYLLSKPLPDRQEIFEYFEQSAGIETVILPKLKRLFDFFRANPVAIRADIRNEYREVL